MFLPISFLAGALLFNLFQYFPFSTGTISAALSLFLISRKKILFVAVAGAGILYAFLRFAPDDGIHAWNRELKVTGRFVPQISPESTGSRVHTFEVENAFDQETNDEIDELDEERITVFSDFAPDYDETYELLLKTGSDRTRLNPGGFGTGRLTGSLVSYRQVPGFAAESGLFFEKQRNALNNLVMSRFDSDSAGLVSAITTGERRYLGEDLQKAFNDTGLAHILSISGTHFGLFSVMLYGLFAFLIKRLPYNILHRLTLYVSPAQAAAVLSIPFMVMYLGLSGGSVPAIRSFVMITLFLAGLLIGRKGFWLHSVLFAALVLVLWDPEVLLSLSFQLSFIAVLVIGFSVEKSSASASEETGSRVMRYLSTMIVIAVAASIGTAPLVAYHFNYFSVLSPVSNLIVAPIIGFLLIPLSLFSSFCYLATGNYVLEPFVRLSADISVSLVKSLSQIPFASVPLPAFPIALVVFFYAALLMYPLSGRSKKFLVVPFIPFVLYAAIHLFNSREMMVTFLDVGQGDAAVAELPDGKTILIDTGRTGREAADFLRYKGKRKVDAIILSHVHPDHSGGLIYLLERFAVNEIWDNGRILYPEGLNLHAKHRVLERGDVLEHGKVTLTVLHPHKDFHSVFGDEYDEENNSSLVVKLSDGNISFLFPGDIEEESEDDLLHLKERLKSDVIKVPHHGSRTSLSETFLPEVSPAVAVISAGRGNAFGHPSPEVLERLQGVRVARTDLDGAVKITRSKGAPRIQTFSDFLFKRTGSVAVEFGNIRRLFIVW